MTGPDSSSGELPSDVIQPRPNPAAAYRCGLTKIGKSCTLGPATSGKCCQDQWVAKCDDQICSHNCDGADNCEISQLKQAGCEEDRRDFQPCIPHKNPWFSRNVWAVNLAILAAGILLACMALPRSEELFAPGQLSKSHAQILAGSLGVDRCGACHPGSHGATARSQEQLCMNCHQTHMSQALHGNPHDLPASELLCLAAQRTSDSNTQVLVAHSQATKCSQCHIEHHGDSRSLKAISDARCQSCHQSQFSSFSQGHPEFDQFPSSDKRRIAFDHQAHYRQYFAQKNADFDCKSCHEVNVNSQTGLGRTAQFEQACQSCHDQPLRASMIDGWAVLQLPSLQVSDTQQGGEHLVHWPAGARYGYDGPITFPMRLLLGSDSTVATAMARFPAGDLSKLSAKEDADVQAVRTIAIALRQLLLETATHGQAAWNSRLTKVAQTALKRELSPPEQQLIKSMVAGLPPDLFQQIQSHWFSGSPSVAVRNSVGLSARLASAQDLLIDDQDSLDNESADELLRSTSTQGLKYPNGPQQPSTSPAAIAPPKSLPNQERTNSASGDDQLIAGEEPESADDLLQKPLANSGNKPPKSTAVSRLADGGWYLDSQLYSIRYMPRGHADPVMAAWIQFSSLIESAQSSMPGDGDPPHALAQSAEFSPGAELVRVCRECHLPFDSTSPLDQLSHWGSLSDRSAKSFTKFDHRPHLTLANTADCQHCHRMNEQRQGSYAEVLKRLREMAGSSPKLTSISEGRHCFDGEFIAMEKSQCSACHRSGAAPEGCTQCHHYHIGSEALMPVVP